jgi:hypothetical protein
VGGCLNCDENGWPIIKPDHKPETEQITIEEYLAQCGIQVIKGQL